MYSGAMYLYLNTDEATRELAGAKSFVCAA